MTAAPNAGRGVMLDAALRYVAKGWSVFPLRGKHPLAEMAPHGLLDAVSDAKTVKRWWGKAPDANIGLVTGTHFWALDVDLKSQGDETLESLELQNGKLPSTLQQETGTGGRHYLFALPPNLTIRNSAGTVGPGLDVRGVGGYIVAPPSVHPDTGRPYQWDGMGECDEAILPAPEWLIAKIQARQSAPLSAQPIPERIAEGGRNMLLFRRAASLRRAGWGTEEMIAALASINQSRCSPPLPDGEIVRIATSASRYDPALGVQEFVSRLSRDNGREGVQIAEPLADWRQMLKRSMRKLAGGKTEPGSPLTHALNASMPLQLDPAFHGAVAWDDLRRQIVIRKPIPIAQRAPCNWEDLHDIAYAAWCQSEGLNISPETSAQAARMVAEANRFHPVREYLQAQVWDGTARITYWLSAYCGCEESAYTQAVGRKWLIAAVARAMCPGCKVDTCLILEGEQGIMKSTALATLGGDWYTDEIEDLTSKDAAQQVSRVWLIEMGELSAMSRSEKNAVKAFISRSVDQFRPAYGRHVVTMPRQCVFAGTTNNTEYLEDETGARRFWPVWCTSIRIDDLRRDRDQLWAEAVAAYMEGEPWWLEDDEAKEAAAQATLQRMRIDPWYPDICSWAESRLSSPDKSVTVAEALHVRIEKKQADWTRVDQMRVGSIFRQMGLVRRRARKSEGLVWEYVKADVPT